MLKLNFYRMTTLLYVLLQFFLTTSNANNAQNFNLYSTPDDSVNYRNRDTIQKLLRQAEQVDLSQFEDLLNKLVAIYKETVQPVEEEYRYHSLENSISISETRIKSKPLILFIGPWSTGKTTMINYLLGMDALRVGAEPTTSEFTILQYGPHHKQVDGTVLVADRNSGYAPLERFGTAFLERLQQVQLSSPLLKALTLVDTPGIIENRKQRERGYPFTDVLQWFIDQADLILVVFDPTKLDVGMELESAFQQLKGRESQIRLILNKADSIPNQQLMRVYGSLFWSLAPLINVTEPPRVYVSSFWQQSFRAGTNIRLFEEEEASVIRDLMAVMSDIIDTKIAQLRHYASRVRIHSYLIDSFVEVFRKEKSMFSDSSKVIDRITADPQKYGVYRLLMNRHKVSRFDLPDQQKAAEYRKFFKENPASQFKAQSVNCGGFFRSCTIKELTNAIDDIFPRMIRDLKQEQRRKTKHEHAVDEIHEFSRDVDEL